MQQQNVDSRQQLQDDRCACPMQALMVQEQSSTALQGAQYMTAHFFRLHRSCSCCSAHGCMPHQLTALGVRKSFFPIFVIRLQGSLVTETGQALGCSTQRVNPCASWFFSTTLLLW
jgi:hypothetical protein